MRIRNSKLVRTAVRFFAVAIILWLGMRFVRGMADRILTRIITGGAR